MDKNRLMQLGDYGQSVWYDNIQRQLLQSGGLKEMMARDGVRARLQGDGLDERGLATEEGENDLDRVFDFGLGDPIRPRIAVDQPIRYRGAPLAGAALHVAAHAERHQIHLAALTPCPRNRRNGEGADIVVDRGPGGAIVG